MSEGRDVGGGNEGLSGAGDPGGGSGLGSGSGLGGNNGSGLGNGGSRDEAGTDKVDDESWPERWLLPGETVLWRGRRAIVRRTAHEAAAAFPAAAAALSYAFFLGHDATRDPSARVWLPLMTAVAAAAVFRALVLAPRALRRQRYALTDQRLLIGSTRPGEPTLSWYRDQLARPLVKANYDGTSDISLGGMTAPDVMPGQATAPQPPVLTSIAHPDLFLVLFSAPPAAAAVSPTVEPLPEASARVDGWSPRPGERVLWSGRAVRRPWRFATEDRFGIAAGMLLPALILTFAVAHRHAPWPVLVVCAAGFLLTSQAAFGRLVWRRIRFARSTYVVTDQRIVCVWKLRRTVVTEADHRTLRPPLVLADGSVFFAESRTPYSTTMWPPAETDMRRLLVGRLWMRPAAVGDVPNFVGLADPGTAAGIAVEARGAAWSRPPDHGR